MTLWCFNIRCYQILASWRNALHLGWTKQMRGILPVFMNGCEIHLGWAYYSAWKFSGLPSHDSPTIFNIHHLEYLKISSSGYWPCTLYHRGLHIILSYSGPIWLPERVEGAWEIPGWLHPLWLWSSLALCDHGVSSGRNFLRRNLTLSSLGV